MHHRSSAPLSLRATFGGDLHPVDITVRIVYVDPAGNELYSKDQALIVTEGSQIEISIPARLEFVTPAGQPLGSITPTAEPPTLTGGESTVNEFGLY